MNSSRLSTIAMGMALAALVVAGPAFGADAEWAEPVNDGTKQLTAILVSVAGGIIGIFIVGYGIVGAMRQRIDVDKLMYIFFGGLIVGIGPAMVLWWIGLFNKGAS